jgi:GrpB-like predicted nucleotidyltransferase (UPF0157 family)
MDEIELVPYDARWPTRFADEARLLRAALAPAAVVAVHHIGSTAIPGMRAKPIIDLLVLVSSLPAARAACQPPLLALGYLFWEANPDRERLFFVKGLPPQGRGRTHHVHISEPTAAALASLRFRDWLRSHPDEARRYAELKAHLALQHRHDREAYTAAKSGYIAAVLAQAAATGAADADPGAGDATDRSRN